MEQSIILLDASSRVFTMSHVKLNTAVAWPTFAQLSICNGSPASPS